MPEIIKNLPSERMLLAPAPGKWNIHDNIAHLSKYQLTFIERIDKILHQDVPHFERYKAEDDPLFESFRMHSDDYLLQCLNEERLKLIELISSVSRDNMGRTGVHKKYGRLNILQWVEFFLLHEAHHLFSIFQLAHDNDLKQRE